MALVTQMVSYQSGNAHHEAYLARPEGTGPFPAILVIHEIFGLNENIKDIARRFADEGYAALAIDLFAGRNKVVCMFRFFGQLQFNPLNNSSIDDLKAGLSYLAGLPEVDGERLGAIGFCMGGGFASAWACKDNRLKAIAPYYGVSPRPIEAIQRSCPVVGSYPNGDFTTSHGHKIEAGLEKYDIPHDIKFYQGARHSFFNDKGPTYNAAAAQDSWSRVLAFFQQYVAAPSS
jgi:carboxymethylenebutenolidase